VSYSVALMPVKMDNYSSHMAIMLLTGTSVYRRDKLL